MLEFRSQKSELKRKDRLFKLYFESLNQLFMDLLEYQAKQLFAQVGIPVLPSQSLLKASDLKHLQIPYPVVLKSQVLASERIKYGGVRFVENTIDAIAVAQSLFNLPIKGEYPQVILAEARYDLENEIFLAIVIDYVLKKPVLLGSAYDRDKLEDLLKNLQQCVIEEEFSPFYARQLAIKMGLKDKSVISVSYILEKMYHLLISYDLDLIEIDPLGINLQGEVMALDGKIRINDYALNRHTDLLEYLNLDINCHFSNNKNNEIRGLQAVPKSYDELMLDGKANLAIVTDNTDQTVFTIKSLEKKGEKINSCYILPRKNRQFWQSDIYKFLLKIIQSQNIKIVLINHANQDEFVNILVKKITNYYQDQSKQDTLQSQYREERQTGVRFENNKVTKKTSSLPQRKINWIINNMFGLNNIELTTEIETIPIHLTNNLTKAIDLIKNIHKDKVNNNSVSEKDKVKNNSVTEKLPLELIKIPSNTRISQRELMQITGKGIGTINRWVKGDAKNIPSWFQQHINVRVEGGKKIMYRR